MSQPEPRQSAQPPQAMEPPIAGTDAQPPLTAGRKPLQAKLIFNPSAGRLEESKTQLLELLENLQACDIDAEVYLVRPGCDLPAVISRALRRGCPLVIAAGGDGTIDQAAYSLVGRSAALGIIPIGTRNNIARSLGIPASIPDAVALLRQGKRIKIDVGQAMAGKRRQVFVETCAIGLGAALYPAADELQKGDLTKLGDLISTFMSHPTSTVTIEIDRRRQVVEHVHMVLVVNTPYVATNLQLASHMAIDDGQLDVFIYSNLNTLDMLAYAAQLAAGTPEDRRIQHFRAREVIVRTNPPMLVNMDGWAFGEGEVKLAIKPRALHVMAPACRTNTDKAIGLAPTAV